MWTAPVSFISVSAFFFPLELEGYCFWACWKELYQPKEGLECHILIASQWFYHSQKTDHGILQPSSSQQRRHYILWGHFENLLTHFGLLKCWKMCWHFMGWGWRCSSMYKTNPHIKKIVSWIEWDFWMLHRTFMYVYSYLCLEPNSILYEALCSFDIFFKITEFSRNVSAMSAERRLRTVCRGMQEAFTILKMPILDNNTAHGAQVSRATWYAFVVVTVTVTLPINVSSECLLRIYILTCISLYYKCILLILRFVVRSLHLKKCLM